MKKLLVVFLAFLTFNAYAQEPEDAGQEAVEEVVLSKEEVLQINENDIVIGVDNAPVTIVEYASMTCSHCASFHNNTFGPLKEKYIDTGIVKFVYRDFPLDEAALRGSMMARCAGKESKEKFMKFTKVMFSTQSNWAPKKNYLEVLSNIGKLGGMKGEDFEACIADKELETAIMETKFNAVKYLEIRSTPSFYVNGELHKGAKDFSYMSSVIDQIIGHQPDEQSKPDQEGNDKVSP